MGSGVYGGVVIIVKVVIMWLKKLKGMEEGWGCVKFVGGGVLPEW